jgi:hypothetical protein
LDGRYVIAGINVVGVSALAGVYGLLANNLQLVGTSLSAGIVGAVLLVMGYSYTEGMGELLAKYSSIVGRVLTPILEDLRLSNTLPRTQVVNGSIYLLMTGSDSAKIKEGMAGVLFSNGRPYIAVPVDRVGVTVGGRINAYSLEVGLKGTLVDLYGLCRDLEVKTGGGVEVRLYRVHPSLLDLPKTPINPVDALVIVELTKLIGRGISFKERVFREDRYVAKFRVGGQDEGT